ncbi:hypothetical protein ASPACDRAFT_34759 [Aspergillus aculeatus ATCC 16872]|uniref:Heme haloperoxidase family profile domain-containing protein n=1 Tax=Aspergillus aculeatus (strain ATCC 16872 / CBS 172.66 / WB 5094) TaxID=690307 RepID=A0A1L9WJN8_ASPA1|nr:uncharacterized protein ASPACDRAFT_34759 [Aspergillus aculeatus ATCC 16872]OJJ96371.1 hypothetical protein ASPACDRAFT_34759 [Aspergillus aculeatus ATCC 16872]
MKLSAIIGLLLTVSVVHCHPSGIDWGYAVNYHQRVLQESDDRGFGLNEPFIPIPTHILPEKRPFIIDESVHYYERHYNGSGPGENYRRASCPAINALANRGYINRTGRNITYAELARAVRRVWNFGDDNDDQVQYVINCPAAPTRNDRAVGDNINLNMTLFESLLSFSKDGETLSLEDMAEHHHLRHNQSKAENPNFVFGNQAQYTNMVGVLGKFGKHGRTTLFLDDVKTFYLEEDIPRMYERREAPVRVYLLPSPHFSFLFSPSFLPRRC